MRHPIISLMPLFVAAAIAGCGDDVAGPGVGTLRVTTSAAGVDLDPDGYIVTLATAAGTHEGES